MTDLYALLRAENEIDGRYELVEQLGRGGQGVVWKVRRIDQSRLLWAAKISLVMWESRAAPEADSARRAWEKETETLKKLAGHRHVIAMHDFFAGMIDLVSNDGEQLQVFCQLVAIDYCPDGDLGTRHNLERLTSLDFRRRLSFLRDVATGILALHELKIVHCDIKPSNVLVFTEPDVIVPKVADFGASQLLFMRSSAGMGTPAYMAPEALAGGTPSFESDIFSLGVTFHHVLTGSPLASPETKHLRPEEERSLYTTLHSHLDYSDSRYSLGSSENEQLRPLLREMLAHNPSERPNTRDVIRQLQELFDAATRDTLTNTRPPSRVLVDTFRWNPRIHTELGERMHFFFLQNQELQEWQKISRRLQEKSLHSFSIHRVIGETDFIVAGWFTDQKASIAREVVSDFRAKSQHSDAASDLTAAKAMPLLQLPRSWERAEPRPIFAEWLSREVQAWQDQEQYRELERRRLILGRLERSERHIRVFLRVDLSGYKDERLTDLYAQKLFEFFDDQRTKKRTHGQHFLYTMTNGSTIIVDYRLSEFRMFCALAEELSTALIQMNILSSKSQFRTVSLMELDPIGKRESDDGRITALLRA